MNVASLQRGESDLSLNQYPEGEKMSHHSNIWRYGGPALAPLIAMAPSAHGQKAEDMGAIEERLSRVERQLEEADEDQLSRGCNRH